MTVPASAAVTVAITLSSGDGSSLSLGTPSSPASELLASFSVVAHTNSADSVVIDDSAGTTRASDAQPYSINTSAGSVSGPGFSFTESGPHAFAGGITLEGSAANGDVYKVLSVAAGEPFNVVTSSSTISTVNVATTNAGSKLKIVGQGTGLNDVILGAGIMGIVNFDEEGGGLTDLTIDVTNDNLSHDYYLSANATTSRITDDSGNYGTITYQTAALSRLTIETDPTLTETLNVDFGGQIAGDGFNPIPYAGGEPGLIFKADGDGTGGAATGDHILNLVGTPNSGQFTGDTWNAQNPADVGPGRFGDVDFNDGRNTTSSLTKIVYSGLTPITDTTPAVNYTFNDFGYPDQSFSATDGPVVSGFQTIEFASTPTPPSPANFETTDIANKNFVTFNTPPQNPGYASPGVIGTVNVPIPSDGLLSLTFNTPLDGENTVSMVNTPPGVVTSLYGGPAQDVSNVTGLGVAAGTVLFLNGGPGTNSLNFDAGGEVPTITPGLLPGEVLVSIPGAGVIDAINYAQINVTDVSPLVITPGPAASINSVKGHPLINAIVGTFTLPIPVLPPPGGFAANDFTASIDWGDPSPDSSAGTVIQDASNPSMYYITGTHTFAQNGTYTVASTIAFAGGTDTASVNGVPIVISYGPSGPTADTSATAVIQNPLSAGAPIAQAGNSGILLSGYGVGSFTDANAGALASDFTGSVDWGDGSPSSVATFVLISPGNFNVYASHTYAKPGVYDVTTIVDDDEGDTTTLDATFTITDLPVTGSTKSFTASEGINTGLFVLATFTDPNTLATVADLNARASHRRLGRRHSSCSRQHPCRPANRRRYQQRQSDIRGSRQPYLRRRNAARLARHSQRHHHHPWWCGIHLDQPPRWRSYRTRCPAQ